MITHLCEEFVPQISYCLILPLPEFVKNTLLSVLQKESDVGGSPIFHYYESRKCSTPTK